MREDGQGTGAVLAILKMQRLLRQVRESWMSGLVFISSLGVEYIYENAVTDEGGPVMS
jgi:hypothetical protein